MAHLPIESSDYLTSTSLKPIKSDHLLQLPRIKSMSASALIQIHLQRPAPEHTLVQLRYRAPNSDGDQVSPVYPAALNGQALLPHLLDPARYGAELARQVFADPDARSWFGKAWTSAEALNAPVRLQIIISPNAPELHAFRWERLVHPETQRPLAAGERVWFSRYLSSQSWRPAELRPRSELKALVAVATPSNLAATYAPINVSAEIRRARQGLKNIPTYVLPDTAADRPTTLNNIIDGLRESGSILYLVCHGALKDGKAILLLENEQGEAAPISGAELATRLSELQQLPRLAVLVSCQSVGQDQDDALLAAGPRLAEAGVPAVLAMQGDLSIV
jgi:hypothetical protein